MRNVISQDLEVHESIVSVRNIMTHASAICIYYC
jgi:hypothetical protein